MVFNVEETYRDWIMAFQQIIELSKATVGDCSWSAPVHNGPQYSSADEVKRFMKMFGLEE